MKRKVYCMGKSHNSEKGYTTYHFFYEDKSIEGFGVISAMVNDSYANNVIDRDVNVGKDQTYLLVYHYENGSMRVDAII